MTILARASPQVTRCASMTPDDQPSVGFRDSLGDRLIGLALIVGGLLGFGLVYLLWLYAPV